MLLNLSVKNYALIRDLDINFERGFTIITGETGAGKSIILGALSLILGSRAETNVLLDKSKKCIIEGTFNIEGCDLQHLFLENEIDYSDISVIRREVNPLGKSRAFINDTPVTLAVLKDLGDNLIDIHSQHQTLLLHDNSFQLNLLDSFAGTSQQVVDYGEEYKRYGSMRRDLLDLKEMAEKRSSDFDYFSFQLKQLVEAKIVAGEYEDLDREQQLLSHAEEVKASLESAYQFLSDDQSSILLMLKDVKANISRVATLIQEGEALTRRIDSSYIELDDLSGEIAKIASRVEVDPQRLSFVNERLDTYRTLMHKHKVETAEELISKREEIQAVVDGISTSDERLAILERELQLERESLQRKGDELSARRKMVIPQVQERVETLLRQLGMPHAKFEVRVTATDDFRQSGLDNVDFLFSANRQVAPENLARVASGGELSRVMLSLKSILSKNNKLPTIIFDEIDSGVSGEVADKVGQILSEMGYYMQVINITHLPQVASRGSHHYHVYKDDNETSTTKIRLLSYDERLREIARLLSGSEVTEIALQNARVLLEAHTQRP